MNLILATDAYKFSHPWLYPHKMDSRYSYVESRGGEHPAVVLFGVKYLCSLLEDNHITMEHVNEAEQVCQTMGIPFYREGWEGIVLELEGRIPVTIKALFEGGLYPVGVGLPLLTVETAYAKYSWIDIETIVLRTIWHLTTVATRAFYDREVLARALTKSSDLDRGFARNMLVDFGARASMGSEAAALTGMAHLLSFEVTDTVESLPLIKKLYGKYPKASSIPATQHSTVTAWGSENERDSFERLLTTEFDKRQVYPVRSCVSDSYDLYHAVENIWPSLKDKILPSGTLVIRPDSGDPDNVLPRVLDNLWYNWGGHVNSKGYKVLDPAVRVIQGDGLTHHSLGPICEAIMSAGFSIENVTFGMGGGRHTDISRDTQKFAMKDSMVKINGTWYKSYKNPVTDPSKASKYGFVKVHKGTGDMYYAHWFTPGTSKHSQDDMPVGDFLQTVYSPVKVLREKETFTGIISRLDSYRS